VKPADKGPAPQTEENTIELLCLGIGGCGKTTFIKQMKIIHNESWTDIELENFTKIIRTNIFQGAQEAVEVAAKHDIELGKEASEVAEEIKDVSLRSVEFNEDLVEKLKTIYEDAGIKKVVEQHGDKLPTTNLEYFLEHLDRISGENFQPNDDDIVRCRQRTAGAYNTSIYVDKKYFEFYDVGGQRPERARWETVMQQHKFLSVLFFVAADEFDVSPNENTTEKTKLELAKNTFREFLEHRPDKKCPVILFINRKDLLEKRLSEKAGFKAFKATFKKYDGEKDADAALQFIEKYLLKDLDNADEVTVHHTCALDKSAMQVVWNSVREGILRATFAKIGV